MVDVFYNYDPPMGTLVPQHRDAVVIGGDIIAIMGDDAITPTEAANYCRIDASVGDTDDAFLNDLIGGVRAYAERVTNRGLVLAQRRISVTMHTSSWIEVPKPPLVSVDSISIVNPDDGTTMTPDYRVSTAHNPPRIFLKEYYVDGLVTVDYTSGYTQATLPPEIKGAMLQIIKFRYDNRGSEEMPEGALKTLRGKRMYPI